jgi:hypothetical protein
MNNTSLLFFSDMCLPYAFYFYLSKHEFTCRNTQVTKHMLNMCLPHGKHAFTSYLPHGKHAFTSYLPHGKHAFTSYLPHVEHAVRACLQYFLLLFKPVVSGCISLASH